MTDFFLFIIYFIGHLISKKLGHLLRYIIYRHCVLNDSKLILLNKSEITYGRVVKSNKKITIYPKNKIKRIGFLGSLSNSLLFSDDFWKSAPNDECDIFVYEFLAKGYSSNKRLSNFTHKIFVGHYFKSKKDRVFKDTFDYKSVAKQINENQLDLLVVSIETLGRFTYSRLFDEIITQTTIICINGGNYPYFHPKVKYQGQIQLPPFWKIIDQVLYSPKDIKIDQYLFVENLFMYDRRDIEVDYSFRSSFEEIIFVHGNLAKIMNVEYLTIVSALLEANENRKFLFMGFKNKVLLNRINHFFEVKGQLNKIKYLGAYSQKKDVNGKIKDKNWEICKYYLKNSAVFLNSFPKTSGSARIEAFASGLPVIDLVTKHKLKHTPINEYVIRSTFKKEGTAYSLEEYLILAKKVFDNQSFRRRIIEEQYIIYDSVCNEKLFWERLMKLIPKDKSINFTNGQVNS